MDVPIDCICPVNHPDGDVVTLREPLDFRSAVTMQKAATILYNDDSNASPEQLLGVLAEAYLLHGVEAWTLQDARGKSIPVSPTTVAAYLLTNVTAAMAVETVADGLYAKAVLLPLLSRASTSSRTTPTTESTSAPTGSPPESPTPLKRSSTSTSRTDATETTSSRRGGASNSSPRSESAA